ncbi:hypothetical protein [Paractinoplanes lichenicola]|uniref:YokE-like PH domain-containing protein n=1 Tax=Paractinoplanes lichenicola TaxID=2802976 RepID=A0ABS1VH56_9ACTN|nr:hypothetical protein [Actinoplanes lichenicola]MBL7254013.1 hypothetical protein [Actinoplanes lichenicola]
MIFTGSGALAMSDGSILDGDLVQQKLEARAFEYVASYLQTGEQPVAAARAVVGKFSASRLGTVVKQGIALEAGGALAAALTKNRKQFVVVTDRRVLFLPQTFLGGPGKKLLGEVPRDQVTLAETKFGVVSLLRLGFAAGEGVSLTFPRVDRKNAESLAAALEQAPVA